MFVVIALPFITVLFSTVNCQETESKELKKWYEDRVKEYDRCVSAREQLRGSHLEMPIDVIVRPTSEETTLHCGVCVDPYGQHDEFMWYQVKNTSDNTGQQIFSLEEIESTSVGNDGTLKFDELDKNHEGGYMCQQANVILAEYYMEVIIPTSKRPVISGYDRYQPLPVEIKQYSDEPQTYLHIETRWSAWSECTKCNVYGEKHRVGYCYVRLERDQNMTDGDFTNEPLIYFSQGIPCTHKFAEAYRQRFPTEIRERKDEIEFTFCRPKCYTGPVVDDKSSGLRVSAAIKPIPKLVKRETHLVRAGSSIELTCPPDKDIPDPQPLVWKFKSQLLESSPDNRVQVMIYKDATGEVLHKLVIQSVSSIDAGTYSCWSGSWLIAAYKIKLRNSEAWQEIPTYVKLIGFVTAVLVCYVIAFKMRKDKKKRAIEDELKARRQEHEIAKLAEEVAEEEREKRILELEEKIEKIKQEKEQARLTEQERKNRRQERREQEEEVLEASTGKIEKKKIETIELKMPNLLNVFADSFGMGIPKNARKGAATSALSKPKSQKIQLPSSGPSKITTVKKVPTLQAASVRSMTRKHRQSVASKGSKKAIPQGLSRHSRVNV